MRKRLLTTIFIVATLIVLVGCGAFNFKASKESELNKRTDIQSEIQTYEYSVDITHDGIQEIVSVSLEDTDEEQKQVNVKVYDETLNLLYEDKLLVHPNLGGSYYLLSYNGEDYFLYYKPSINHDTVSCLYEVFYLNEAGEKIIYDSNEIEMSLFDVQGLDKDAWKLFAEEENKYFENAFLLARTYDGVLEYSTDISKITYLEKFSWLMKDGEDFDIDTTLEKFVQEIQQTY